MHETWLGVDFESLPPSSAESSGIGHQDRTTAPWSTWNRRGGLSKK